jgi:two-component system response regulator WspF
VRIAVVNDLRLAREVLQRVVASDPQDAVAWTASEGEEAVARCREDRPDLVLMDLVMPGVDGVEATRRIMRETPCPILVVTATVEGYASKVFHALGAGAVDAVKCPTLGPDGRVQGAEPLLRKIRALRILAQPAPPASRAAERVDAARPAPRSGDHPPLVLLGASTGGPQAVVEVFRGLSPGFLPAVLLVQHIDVEFAAGFVAWLAAETQRDVEAAAAGAAPSEGRVLVATSSDHLVMRADGTLGYEAEPRDLPYRPSVDVLFESVARAWPAPGVAAVLTGMGRDGARGLRALRQAGWATLAQDAATCVVWGMPRACQEEGAAQALVPLHALGARIEAEWSRLAAAAGRRP